MTSLINFSGPVNMEITVRAFAARLVRQTIQFTKTLIAVLAIPLAMHTASGEERFSKNIVGYVRLPLAPGDNLIANPLNGTNNHLNTILRLAGDGSQDNAQISRWNVAAQTFYGTVTWFGGFGWLSDDLTPTGFILNPGEAFFFRNPLSNSFDATFVGEVPQGMLTNPLPAPGQIAFRSSIVPQTARIGSASAPGTLMFPAFNGDVIRTLNPATQTYATNQYVSGLGWNPGHPLGPIIPVATGFLVQKNGGASNWITFFGVNENGPPQITQQPQSQIVNSSGTAVLDFGVAGAFPLSYQWHVNCRNIANATNATLTISNAGPLDVGAYSVTITNLLGQVTSWDATLALNSIVPTALQASLTGSNISLQWPLRDVPYQLQEADSLNALPAPWTNSDLFVSRVGTNQTTFTAAGGPQKFFRLALVPLRILVPPLGRSANLGDSVAISVTATGTPPFSYQWRLNGFNVPGATNATFLQTLTNEAQFGAYHVAVDDATGTAGSRPAVLRPAGLETALADAFTNRPLFTNFAGSIRGVTYGATREPAEPEHARLPGGKSVWLKWRVPTSGVATFDTGGSGFDTLLAVYQSDTIPSLLPVESDDDAAGHLRSRVRFNVVQDVDYSLALDGLAGAEGFFVLNWSFLPLAATSTIPIITAHPQDSVVASNTATAFTVSAVGLPPATSLTYQWYFNGAAIPAGQTGTNPTLQVGPGPGQAPPLLGPYFVDVMNGDPALTVRSRPAYLQFSSHPGFHFVVKPLADLLCDATLAEQTNCCGSGFAGGANKPAQLLSPGIGLAVGGLISGPTPLSGASSQIKAWAWSTNGWSSATRLTLTGAVTVASGGYVQISMAESNVFGNSPYTLVPSAASADPKISLKPSYPNTPKTTSIYFIGLGRTPSNASFSLTYTN